MCYTILFCPGRTEEAARGTVCPAPGAGGETAQSGASARGGTAG